MFTTNGGLLKRLKEEGSDAAWAEFFALYGPATFRYALRLGLKEEDAKDVVQATMIDILRVMPEFEYDRTRGRFRNFLFTIVHRKALRHFRRERARPEAPLPDGVGIERVEQVTDEDPDVRERWMASLLDGAIQELESDPTVLRRDIAIFLDYARAGATAPEVAEKHGVSEAMVYQIKTRLLRRLRSRADWLWRNLE